MSKVAMGIHTGHDRGVSLIVDGEIIGALSQERIDRIKHSRSYELPYEAINKLLEYTGLKIEDIDCIGLSEDAIDTVNILDFLKDEFQKYYKCKSIPMIPIRHHLSHAEAVYGTSHLDKCLILVADGGGDYINGKQESESLYFGNNNKVTLLEHRIQDPTISQLGRRTNHVFPYINPAFANNQISIGRKYEQFTYLLGFNWGEAGKTMGLSSYGNSLLNFDHINIQDLKFNLTLTDILQKIYFLQILSGKSFFEYVNDEKANIAKTIQEFTERSLISLIKNVIIKYNIKKLCLAGGVFLNCMLNHKIIQECELEDLFIFPAAGDDGQAIGNAIHAYKHFFGDHHTLTAALPYLGLSYTDKEIEQILNTKNLRYTKLDDKQLAIRVASYLRSGAIVGLHRGRTEIGPRALCHRSILADPTYPNTKELINKRVKHRESFRPFAPVVTYEDQFKIFNLDHPSPYMLFATTVKEEYKDKIPSVTHIDGTARVQAIKKTDDSFVHMLLKEFEILSGLPVLLNTSFNMAGEPIVESPLDAIQTFLRTEIDILVINNFIVEKNDC